MKKYKNYNNKQKLKIMTINMKNIKNNYKIVLICYLIMKDNIILHNNIKNN